MTVWRRVSNMFRRNAIYSKALTNRKNYIDLQNQLDRCNKRRSMWAEQLAECMRQTVKEVAISSGTRFSKSVGWLTWVTAAAALFASSTYTDVNAHKLDRLNAVQSIDATHRLVYHPQLPTPKRRMTEESKGPAKTSNRTQTEGFGSTDLTDEDQRIVHLVHSIADGSHPTWTSARMFVDRATTADVLALLGPTAHPSIKTINLIYNMITDKELTDYHTVPYHVARDMRTVVMAMLDKTNK